MAMPYAFPPDVQRQINERMASGRYATEDEVLRDAFESLAWEERELKAVMQAVEALDNGDEGLPLDAAFDQLRQKHGVRGDG